MARIRFTQHANSYMMDHRITVYDVIEVIGGYETIQQDVRQTGLIRAGKMLEERMVWVIYTAIGDSLLVVSVSD
ncbi:MAG: hypothetical protein HW403_1024 [Dehalococcoidia bacterium]|nr:hypothetical protein [Dehalococcoidia bacterium]